MSNKADTIDHLVKIFRTFIKYPSPTAGRILRNISANESMKVLSTWTQKDLVKGKPVKIKQLHICNKAPFFTLFASDVTTEMLSSISPSENLQAIIRDGSSESPKKQYVEVWQKGRLETTFDVTSLDVHGDIYVDSEFGCLEWSPDETKLVYIAEKKVAKSEPFYKQKPLDNKQDGSDTQVTRGEQFLYRPDWGEQLVDKREPVVMVCDLPGQSLRPLSGVPAHYSPGQVVWGPRGEALYGVVLENEPRRLGATYCTNRPGYIFRLTLAGEFSLLSGPGLAVRSPRLSPDGETLVWLQRTAGGPHMGCQQLVRCDLASGQSRVVVDTVRRDCGSGFLGIYTLALPRRCFSRDGSRLYLSSHCTAAVLSYQLHLESGKVERIPGSEQFPGSLSVLDVTNDCILASWASVRRPHSLLLAEPTEPGSGGLGGLQWRSVTEPEEVLPGVEVKVMHHTATSQEDSFRSFSSLLVLPGGATAGTAAAETEGSVPLVVFPHGGPHSCSVDTFTMDVAFYTSLGMAVLLVNYRGSTGAGQDGVEFLLGRIGDTDVKDCQQAVGEALRAAPQLDGRRLALYGGSHGGFLVAHLSAQYPDMYRAVAARNPVIDVAAMYTVSDIPDWTVVEAGWPLDEARPLSPQQVAAMQAASPISLVHLVQAPTLLLLGSKDLRVPPSQGLLWYNSLRARTVPTRLNLYEDNHPLGGVPVELDSVVHCGLWFAEHVPLHL